MPTRRDRHNEDGTITRMQHHSADRVGAKIQGELNASDRDVADEYVFGYEYEYGRFHFWNIPAAVLAEKGYFLNKQKIYFYILGEHNSNEWTSAFYTGFT